MGRQPGEEQVSGGGGGGDEAEVYVMGIQKTGRGAKRGRVDRKKSYKACDMGILVTEVLPRSGGSNDVDDADTRAPKLGAVTGGRFFGLTRNGHVRLVLDRRNPDAKFLVIPVSFGHPRTTNVASSYDSFPTHPF